MLSMLTLQHGAHNLTLLLNSGTLALAQTALRLIGGSAPPGLGGEGQQWPGCLSPSLLCSLLWYLVRHHWYKRFIPSWVLAPLSELFGYRCSGFLLQLSSLLLVHVSV